MYIFLSVVVVLFVIGFLFSRHKKQQLTQILNSKIPYQVIAELKVMQPNWTKQMLDDSLTGFKEYLSLFIIAKGKKIGMPSLGIDEVWHAFLKHPELYNTYCKEYIGRVINHHPYDKKPKDMSKTIKFSWDVMNTCQILEQTTKVMPKNYKTINNIPLIFAFDNHYKIDGWIYTEDVYQRLLSISKSRKKSNYTQSSTAEYSLDNSGCDSSGVCDGDSGSSCGGSCSGDGGGCGGD